MFDALSQIFSGNLFWIVDVIANNLHWGFALLAFVVITFDDIGFRKNYLRNFVFLVLFLWAFSAIADLTGLLIFSAGIYLIFQLVLKIFWPSSIDKKHPSLQLYVIVAGFLLFSFLLTFGLM